MAEAKQPVRLYFDFVSPYSWLALMQAAGFGRQHGIDWDLRPVVYAKLLDASGLVGPAEIAAKRRYTFADVVRCAAAAGLPFAGPPAHPFRSLEALRTACLFREDARALELCAALADGAWGQGRDLTDMGVIAAVVEATGLPAEDLAGRIAAPEIKIALRDLTAAALDAGIFGVPTFALDDELFWGHDRMDHLAARLADRIPSPRVAADTFLERPRGADRKGSPFEK